MPKKFDPTLPVCVPSGQPVRIVCTDRKTKYPIIALITMPNGKETLHGYSADGTQSDFKSYPSIANVPRKGYINIWQDDCDGVVTCTHRPYQSAEEAKKGVSPGATYLVIALQVNIPV